MKFISTRIFDLLKLLFILLFSSVFGTGDAVSQTTLSLGNPSQYIYALTDQGEILEINTSTAATNRTIKDATYPGNPVISPNAIGYNPANDRFYYFKRNYSAAPNEFVSFNHSA